MKVVGVTGFRGYLDQSIGIDETNTFQLKYKCNESQIKF